MRGVDEEARHDGVPHSGFARLSVHRREVPSGHAHHRSWWQIRVARNLIWDARFPPHVRRLAMVASTMHPWTNSKFPNLARRVQQKRREHQHVVTKLIPLRVVSELG